MTIAVKALWAEEPGVSHPLSLSSHNGPCLQELDPSSLYESIHECLLTTWWMIPHHTLWFNDNKKLDTCYLSMLDQYWLWNYFCCEESYERSRNNSKCPNKVFKDNFVQSLVEINIITRRLTNSKRAPPNVSKLALFLLSHQKFQWSKAFKECVLHVFINKVKVFGKVKYQWVKVMVSNERSCQKEYTCEIWKFYHPPIKSYDQG
jgi:hypothetical protein